MATIKSYTDIEQSKKLAKILPIESADMFYNPRPSNEIPYVGNTNTALLQVPCWSLSALINVIPQEIFDGEYIINITEGRNNRWILTYDCFKDGASSYYGLSTGADNLVDACTDIIIKLRERNII